MLRLSGATQKLQALLGGAVAATQPDVVVSYRDVGNPDRAEFDPGVKVSVTNNGTAVDICDAPSAATVREIDFVSIRNNDSASATVTVRLNNNGTTYKLVKATLATLEHLYYSHVAGWYVLGTRGQLKNSVTGLLDLSASTAGQIKFPATQNASSDANTLDDYEEQDIGSLLALTFSTPGDLSVAYSGFKTGRRTKTGRAVLVEFNILTSTFTHTTAAGVLKITGLPEAASGTNYIGWGNVAWGGITKAGYTQIVPVVVTGNDYIQFVASGSGVALDDVDVLDVPTGGTVRLGGFVAYTV